MSESDPGPSAEGERPRVRRRWWRAVLALAILATLLGTHGLWLPPLAERALPVLAARLGHELTRLRVERLDLTGLVVSEVRLEGAPTSALAHLELERLELEGTPALWLGDLAAAEELQVHGLRLDLRGTEREPAGAAAPPAWPASLPRLEATDLEVRLLEEAGPRVLFEGGRLVTGAGGSVEVAAVLGEQQLEGRGRYADGQLDDLEVRVDGEPLLRDSRLGFSTAEGLELEVQLAVAARRASLAARLLEGQARWRLEVEGLDLERLAARLPEGLLGETAPSGLVDLDSEGELELDDPLGGSARGSLAAGDLSLGGWDLDEVEARLDLGGGELRVPELVARLGERNRLRLEEGRLPLRDLSPLNLLARASARLDLELEALEELLEPAGVLPPEGLVRHRLALSARVAEERLSVREGELRSDAGDLRLTRAELWLERGSDGSRVALDIDGVASVQDLTAFGELLGRRGWGGELEGDLHAEGTWPSIRLEADLDARELELEGATLGTLEARVRTDRSLSAVELERLVLSSPQGAAEARARLVREAEGVLRLEVEALRLAHGEERLELQQPATVRLRGESVELGTVVLAGTAGHLEGSGSWSEEGARADLVVHELRPAALLSLGPPGLPSAEGATLRLHLEREGSELRLDSSGRIAQLDLGSTGPGVPLDLAWDLAHDGRLLQLTSLAIDGGTALELDASGVAPLTLLPAPSPAEGDLQLRVQASGELAALVPGAGGSARLEGDLGGSWSALTGDLALAGAGLLLPEAEAAGLEPGSLEARVKLGDGLELRDLSLRFGERLDLSGRARLALPLDASAWLADADSALADATLTGELELTSLDVEELRGPLEQLGLSDLLRAGRLSGRLALGGPLLDPAPRGELRLEGGRLRPGGGLPSLDAIEARLSLTRQQLRLEECAGTLGAAPFTLAGGVRLDGEEPELDLTLAGEDLLLFRNRSTRVRADTSLHLGGPPSAPRVTGEVRLTQGRYAPDTRFLNLRPGPARAGVRGLQLFSLREPPLSDLSFDVEVTSAEPFRVRNLVLDGSMSPDVRLTGTGRVPVLEGRIYLTQTALLLPAGRLTLTGGTVLFSRDDPFLPTIEAVGEARMLGHDIRAGITGPYDNPEIELSSTPPLGQEALLVLLLTGQLQQSATGVDDRATATTVAVYIAQDTLGRLFAGDGPVNEDSIFERLDLLYGEDVSQNGTETFDAAFRLTAKEGLPEELRNRRHLFLTAQRDRYEDYNYGLRFVLRVR